VYPEPVLLAMQTRYATMQCCYFCFQILEERYRYLEVSFRLGRLVGLKADLDKEMAGFLDSKSRFSTTLDNKMMDKLLHGIESQSGELKLSRKQHIQTTDAHHAAGGKDQRYWKLFLEIVRKKMVIRQQADNKSQRNELLKNVTDHVEAKMKENKMIREVFLSGFNNDIDQVLNPEEVDPIDYFHPENNFKENSSKVSKKDDASSGLLGVRVSEDLLRQGAGAHEGGFRHKQWTINYFKR
jgi:hypothetical protein